MSHDNFYEILGVSHAANESEIRKAYYQKAKIYHPDLDPDSTEKFNLIKRAYESLLDPLVRSTHDSKLGVNQQFGNSTLRQEMAGLSAGTGLNFKSKSGIVKTACGKLLAAFKSLFGAGRVYAKPVQESNQTASDQSLKSDSATEYRTIETTDFSRQAGTEKRQISLALYSEASLPITGKQRIVLSAPVNGKEVDLCLEMLRRTLAKYAVVSKAIMIEARLSDIPDEKIYLVSIEKQLDRSWGIDDMQTIQIEPDSEDYPGLLFCCLKDGPFAEAVTLYGIEFYPRISAGLMN